MIKIQLLGNLLARSIKAILIFVLLQISWCINLFASSNSDIIEELKILLRDNKALMFNPLSSEIEISYEIDKNSKIDIENIESFNIKLNQINKKNRRFKGVFIAHLRDDNDIIAPITGSYEEYVQIPVLKIAMRTGEMIRASDIDIIKVNAVKLKYNTILTDVNLYNKTPRSFLLAYQAITEKQLMSPKIISKNDIVTALYERNNLVLKLEVLALESGAVSEKIRVKNQRSGATFEAIVRDRNTVYVK